MSTDVRRPLIGAVGSLLQRIASFVRRRVCALRGHDLMMDFAPKRLSLRCTACGFNTPGWELDLKAQPAVRQPRIRVVARTAPVVVKPRQIPVPSHATDHASAA